MDQTKNRDRVSVQVRSRIMGSIKSTNTQIERAVFRELRKHGINFQKHYKKALGSPDIALPRKKIAIFIDGDFWHGYRYSTWKSRLNSGYWTQKIENNMKRDKRNFRKLRSSGWKVYRVWEQQIVGDLEGVVKKILDFCS